MYVSYFYYIMDPNALWQVWVLSRKYVMHKPWKTNNETELETIMRRSVGTIIHLDNTPYILTCSHGVINTIETYVYYYQQNGNDINAHKTEVDIIAQSVELDLALLSFPVKCQPVYDINSLVLQIPYSDLFFQHRSTNKQDFNVIHKLPCAVERVLLHTIGTCHMAKIPDVQLKILDDTFNKEDDIAGISGSCVFDSENNIMGVIIQINHNSNLLSLVPAIAIKRFLEEVKLTGRFRGLCDLIIEASVIELDHMNKRQVLQINHTFGISYKLKNKPSLKSGHILLELNHQPIQITDTGFETECPQLGMSIPIDTYISLMYSADDVMEFSVWDKQMKTNKPIKAKAIVSQEKRTVPICSDNAHFIYNGLVFTELSEQKIKEYRLNGIHLTGASMDKFLSNPYSSSVERVIIVEDVVLNGITEETARIYNGEGLPFIHINDRKYSLCVVEKINKRKIKSLGTAKKLLIENTSVTLLLRITKDHAMRIKYKDGQLIKLSHV